MRCIMSDSNRNGECLKSIKKVEGHMPPLETWKLSFAQWKSCHYQRHIHMANFFILYYRMTMKTQFVATQYPAQNDDVVSGSFCKWNMVKPCNETALELVASTLQHKETEALWQGCPAEMNAAVHYSLTMS